MFTKQEIKDRVALIREQARAAGNKPLQAELNMAVVVLGCALFDKKLRSGEDYAEHPMHVATAYTRSKSKRIVGILHDVIEDSDWTLDDLREVGFSERIIKGVDGVTKRKGELYFDFIVRCGLSGEDAIDTKINDLQHNSDSTRYRHIDFTDKQLLKQQAYNLAYHYLVDIKKGWLDPDGGYNTPGTSIVNYVRLRREYSSHPAIVNRLLDEFSSSPERLPIPAPAEELRL